MTTDCAGISRCKQTSEPIIIDQTLKQRNKSDVFCFCFPDRRTLQISAYKINEERKKNLEKIDDESKAEGITKKKKRNLKERST